MRRAGGITSGLRMAAGLVVALGILAVAGDASAFCRSTTCRATANKDCPADDDGCPSTGAQLFWPSSCISYATNKLGTQDLDPADSRAVIKKCFEAWSDVQCPDGTIAKMTFQEREPVDCKKSEYNKSGPNVNVILFQDDNWNYRGIDGTLAKTSVTYNDDTGEIYDADIEVNTANNTVTITDDPAKVEYDLQSILTHEAGHFIGIAHSPDPDAVMFASYSPGSLAQRELTPDDVGAICAIYPSTSTSACNTEPRGGFSGTCDDPVKTGLCSVQPSSLLTAGNGGSYSALGLFLGAALLATRARRRRGTPVSASASVGSNRGDGR